MSDTHQADCHQRQQQPYYRPALRHPSLQRSSTGLSTALENPHVVLITMDAANPFGRSKAMSLCPCPGARTLDWHYPDWATSRLLKTTQDVGLEAHV
jgi:hypothetical protein